MKDATAADVLNGTARHAVACGDCVAWLNTLPTDCVHSCITSPPYFGLRDYGTATWDGGDPACQHSCGGQVSDTKSPGAITAGVRPGCDASRCRKCGAVRVDQQIGLESTPAEYVARLVEVFAAVRRVLHPSGSLWLNLGDSFSGSNQTGGTSSISGVGKSQPHCAKPKTMTGTKPKDLLGIPWRVAFALQADGWYLRQWCPWVKRNPMPESVTDRPGTGCEVVFLLAKRSDYFFDMEAVKRTAIRAGEMPGGNCKVDSSRNDADRDMTIPVAESRNFRSSDLWFDSVGLLLAGEADDDAELLGFDVTVKGYKRAHFAVMPKMLVEPCVLAGTSAKGVCPKCASPWVRVVKKDRKATRPGKDTKVTAKMNGDTATAEANGWNRPNVIGNRDPQRHVTTTETTGWKAGCSCDAGEPVPSIVMDPFTGSGTVPAVAVDLGRRAIGSELNPAYIPLIRQRMLRANPPLFGE